MRVPLSWLKEYVDVEASAQEIAERLTFSGIEVEGIDNVGSDYEGLVAARIVEVEPHPNAERLRLCRVNAGEGDVTVVCGADNFVVGDVAPFAGVGCKLPNGMLIRKAKIRGEESFGMLCAEDELGLSDDHSGILLLPRETRPGTPLSDVLGPPETVLVLEITWNRPDCLSIVGVAREVAALFGSGLRLPGVEFKESGSGVGELAKVTVEDKSACPRYTGRVLTDVRMGPSPAWMQRRLSLCGIRPINAVVDVTNYVLLECGHPLHAFDYDLVAGHEIVVRRARSGERMRTLDDIDRAITPEMLVIADAEGPVAIAGVMGGAGSEIRDETSGVLLESASFDPALIRRTSSSLGLSTESSHRFERGVDVCGVEWASRRAAALMAECCGAVAAKGVIDIFPAPPEDRRITCRWQRIRDLLGIDIADDEVVGILESLEIAVPARDGEVCSVQVPSFRPDLTEEADIIEEVARMHGIDKVPATVAHARLAPDSDDEPTRAVMACRRNLIGLGLAEIMNYSFVSGPDLDLFADDADRRIVLPNPVSADHSILRTSLMPQMVESLGRNLSRQITDAAFFEIGRVFFKNDAGSTWEQENVSIGMMGKAGRGAFDTRRDLTQEEMFGWLSGLLESLCKAQHVGLRWHGKEAGVHQNPGKRSMELRGVEAKCFEPGYGVSVVIDGVSVGVMGLLARQIREKWRMVEPVGVAEIELEPLKTGIFQVPVLHPIPSYPAITRDMAIVVDEELTHEKILEIIWKAARKELTDVRLFDIFRGKSIGEAKKSLAYSFVYRSLDRTLTDEDANKYHSAMKNTLKSALDVEIREG